MRRYEIQFVNLDDVVKKSEIVWQVISRAWTLDGARSKFERASDPEHPNYVLRIFDTKTGKPVA